MMGNHKMTGYHGTTAKAAACIRAERRFRESKKDNEWLGAGVYFFAYEEHARRWVGKRGYRGAGAIVRAQLEFDDTQWLDLDDPAQRSDLNSELKELGDTLQDSIFILPSDERGNDLWKRWCLGCNIYRKLHPEIGITSYTFPQGSTGHSGFRDNEKQICVSDHKIITEIA